MIRKRTADGGEVVSPGSGGDYTPTTPSFGVDENGSPMLRETSLKLRENFPISHPRQRRNSNGSMRDSTISPSFQPRERRDSITSVRSETGEDKKKRLNFGIFQRSKDKEKETADWVSIESKSSGDSEGKRTGIRATLSRLSSGVGSKRDSSTVIQNISQRVDERKKGGTPWSAGPTLSRKGSTESIRSLASVSGTRGPTALTRSKTVGPGGLSSAAKHEKKVSRSASSRIPTVASSSPSPSPSRPNSSQSVNRRPYSTVSSSSDRIPLRSPSQTSVRSRPSAPSSPSASSHHPSHPAHLQYHRRRESVPVNGKSSIPTPVKMAKPPTFKRAESAPSQHARAASAVLPQTKPLGQDEEDHKVESAPKKELETDDEEPADDEDNTPKKELDIDDTPAGNRTRKMSDPFAPRSKPDTDHSQIIFAPEGLSVDHLDESEHLRSPALSDFDELHESGSASPLFGRGSDGTAPKRSPLEEEDSDTESLQALMHDEGYTELLNKQQEEDDTFNLLSDLRSHTISKPTQDFASSKEEKPEGETENAKLLNKLKTLHLELRSARQGIDYIERRLNGGASSDDESEWIDEDDAEHEGLRDRKHRPRAPATDSPQSERSTDSEKSSSPIKYWILFALQFALIWMLLELAIFYHSFPPSVSNKHIIAIVPDFGTQTTRYILSTISDAFNLVFYAIPLSLWFILLQLFDTVAALINAGNKGIIGAWGRSRDFVAAKL